MDVYCFSLVNYRRRRTSPVTVGQHIIGGRNPVVVQSMIDRPTMDTNACVSQIIRLSDAGCNVVRLTARNRNEADNLANISRCISELGLSTALVADIHFNPQLAYIAADHVDKIRINPGNYILRDGNFIKLIEKCRRLGRSIRIGVNHGSLAPHIVERYGDTPRGMVESAMEFLTVCRECDFDQVVVSMKSSNARVMVHAYRLLASCMLREKMTYPIHLGVTEAGDGLYGRIKSAVGIGALLADGIGETVRVSLTEDPCSEIPVARSIIDHTGSFEDNPALEEIPEGMYKPFEYNRRCSTRVGNLGGGEQPLLYDELDQAAMEALPKREIAVLEAAGYNAPAEWRSLILNMDRRGDKRPVIIKKQYNESDPVQLAIKAAVDFGMLLIDGLADGIWITNNDTDGDSDIAPELVREISLDIMQAARARMTSTEYISCPGCGRTTYDLQGTLSRVKQSTNHLKHLKIAVMGCIVNGPGEMADADYGYIGEGGGKVSLYKGRDLMERSVPEEDAVAELIKLIKANGDWYEP